MCCPVVTRFLSGVRTVKIRASCRGERHRVATESSLFLLLLVVWLMLVVVFRRRLSKWACWLSFALPALAAWRLFFGGRYFVLCACATGVAAVAAVAYPSFTPTKSCFDSRVCCRCFWLARRGGQRSKGLFVYGAVLACHHRGEKCNRSGSR